MKKILLFILFTFLSLNSYSQKKNTIYVDENYKEIDQREFKKKSKSDFFNTITISNDTAIFKKLKYEEFFGKLDVKKKHQLNILLQKRYNIDSTKVWIVHYEETSPPVKRHKKSGYILLDSVGNEHGEIISWEMLTKTQAFVSGNASLYKYVKSYKDYIRTIHIEQEYLGTSKKNQLLHFYNYDNNLIAKKDEYNWIKDSNKILKNTFTDGISIYPIIVVHPNGSFYMIRLRDSLDKQKAMINFNSYERRKRKWIKEKLN